MITRIEHLNITVPDIDEAIKFLQIVAPDFEVRRDDTSLENSRWVHIGNDNYYFALQEPHPDTKAQNPHQSYKDYGINHVALVVQDLKSIVTVLQENNYKKGIDTPIEKYRKRAYYYDGAGLEWELTEYLSDNTEQRYLYE